MARLGLILMTTMAKEMQPMHCAWSLDGSYRQTVYCGIAKSNDLAYTNDFGTFSRDCQKCFDCCEVAVHQLGLKDKRG